jgi:hypothetical protein
MESYKYYIDQIEPPKPAPIPIRKRVHLRESGDRITVMIDDLCIIDICDSGQLQRWNYCSDSGLKVDDYGRPVISNR